MKKIIFFIVLLSLCLLCTSVLAESSGTIGDITWQLSNEGELMLEGNGSIPNYGEAGTSTASPFVGNADIRRIVIAEGITEIGKHAFQNCTALEAISFPSTLTSVGTRAFAGCSALTSIYLPDSVQTMERFCFEDCISLSELSVPFAPARFGALFGEYLSYEQKEGLYDATQFYSKKGSSYQYVNYYVPTSLQRITVRGGNLSAGTFCGIRATEINMPAGISEIPDMCFRNSAVQNVIFPAGVTRVGTEAFLNCKNLTTLQLNDNLLTISNSAFRECSALKSTVIPDSVTSLGYEAFYSCTDLTDVTVSENVTSLTSSVFANCTALRHIRLPRNLASVEQSAFTYVPSDAIYGVYDDSFAYRWAVQNNRQYELLGLLGSGSCGDDLQWRLADTGKLTISGTGAISASDIWDYPWYYNRAHDELMNNRVSSIVLEEGVTDIPAYCFYKTGATTISLPSTLTFIGQYAFEECHIASFTIPASVITIASDAFYGMNADVVFMGDAPANGDYAFERATLRVSYPANNNTWTSQVRANMTQGILANVTWIVNGICEHSAAYTRLENYVMPSCTTEGYSGNTICDLCDEVILSGDVLAMIDHSPITTVESIPATCTTAGMSECIVCSVCGVTLQESEDIPATGHVVVVDASVAPTYTENGFTEGSHCSVCEEVLIAQDIIPVILREWDMCLPDALKAINEEAFMGNVALYSVSLPEGCTAIGNRAFADCANLQFVCIPNPNCAISDDAFDNNSNLVIVTVCHSDTWTRAKNLGLIVALIE